MEVTKKTTFGQGLFSPEECDSGNLSDKQAKLDFLNKAISVTCFALGENVDVSAPCLPDTDNQNHGCTSNIFKDLQISFNHL